MKAYKAMQKYETPCMEVNYFEAEDVILTSGDENPDIGGNPDEPDL